MKTNQRSKSFRLVAFALALLMVLGASPMGMLASVFAQTVETFTVRVVDGEGNALPINDGMVILTDTLDAGITATADLTAGVASFVNFVDDAGTYEVKIMAFGYEPFSGSITVSEDDTNADVTGLVELPKFDIITSVESAVGTGTITPGEKVYSGEKRDIVVTAATGYIIESITINNVDFYRFTDLKSHIKTVPLDEISENKAVKATFVTEIFNITTSVETAADTGTITASTAVDYDGSVDITVTAGKTEDMQYQIEKILVNGVEVTGITNVDKHTISLTKVQKDYTIKAYFKVKEYKVNFTIAGDGSVTVVGEEVPILSPGGNIIAEYNDLLSFVVTANQENGYHIGSIMVNTVEKINDPDNDTTTFAIDLPAIVDKYEISVTFAINTYELTVTAGENGSVLLSPEDTVPVTPLTVESGSIPIFKILPDEGYKIKEIKIDDQVINLDTDLNYTVVEREDGEVYYYNCYYTFSAITDNASINVSFEIKPLITDEEKKYYSIDFYPASTIDPPVRSESNDEGTRVYILKNDAYAIISPVTPYNKILVSTITSNYRIEYERRITTIIPQNDISVREYKFDFKKDKELDIDNDPIKIIIDKTKPVINTISSQGWTNQVVSVAGTVSDIGDSGLKYVRYGTEAQYNADTYESTAAGEATLDTAKGTWEFSLTEDQNKIWYVWAYDLAGNKSDFKTTTVKIDTVKPEITGFLFSKIEPPKVEKLISFLTFGTFFNETIQVTVSATDNAAGVKEIALFAGERKIDPKSKDNGTATFEINATDFDGKTISAIAQDNAGNASDVKKPSDVDPLNTNATSDSVMIEGIEPTIVITPDIKEDNPVYNVADGKKWYAKDLGVTVTVADNTENVANSGLRSVSIKINNDIILEDKSSQPINQDFSLGESEEGAPAVAVKSKTFIVNTDQASRNDVDGSYTIEVTVTDNAGNVKVESLTVYKDIDKPEITGFVFTPVNNGPITSAINFLTFGVFCKEKIEVTITANDEPPSSGLKSITLYTGVGETLKEFATQDLNEGNQTTFKLLADEIDISKEGKYFDEALSAVATDNVGNKTETPAIPDTRNAPNLNRFMIETVLPTIGLAYPDATYTAENGARWYERDIPFTVTAKDKDAGIRNVIIEINGLNIGTDKNGKNINESFYTRNIATEEEVFVINTDQATRGIDGSYTIKVTVIDNAGNVVDDSRTIYKDTSIPVITGFEFASATPAETETPSVNGNNTTVEVTDYGFYFKEDTTVTVTARDDSPTSGLKTISYYLDDIEKTDDGKAENAVSLSVVTKENTDNQNLWTSTFVVPANFKGQVYAKATDNVNNTPADFVNPNSAIVESLEKHEDETHVKFDKVETAFKDINGLDLYAVDTDVTLTVTDTYSGLRKIEWWVEAPYDTANNQSGNFTINNDKTYAEGSITDGWAQTKTDINLVTEMTKTLTISNNSNAIAVRVRITDRAGNVTDTNEILETDKNNPSNLVFSIDKTVPEITVTYDGNGDSNLPTNSLYYQKSRIARVVVYERNFAEETQKVVDGSTELVKYMELLPKNLYGYSEASIVWVDGKEDKENPDRTEHIAEIRYESDGHYEFALKCMDLAENKVKGFEVFENRKDTARLIEVENKDEFYVDLTDPVIYPAEYFTISATPSAVERNTNQYYNKTVAGEVTISERNFRKEDIVITEVSSINVDTAENLSFPVLNVTGYGDAKNDGTDDERKATVLQFSDDARYQYKVTYTDLAGRTATEWVETGFTIDTQKPVCKIMNEGSIMETRTAYGKDAVIAPKIEFADFDLLDSTSDLFTLECLGETVKDEAGNEIVTKDVKPDPESIKQLPNKTGGTNSIIIEWKDFEKTIKYDNIYRLTASVKDKADWVSDTQEVLFSINRFGAVYVYDSETQKVLGSYTQKKNTVTVQEINATAFFPDTVKVKISDGISALPKEVKEEASGYTLKHNAETYKDKGTWFEAIYSIDELNFADDADYVVQLSDKDEAGNQNANSGLSNAPDENANEKPKLDFTVDHTPPTLDMGDLTLKKTHPDEKKEITLTITDDNLDGNKVTILLDDIALEEGKEEKEGQYKHEPGSKTWTFLVEQSTAPRNLNVIAYDKANNEGEFIFNDFVVSKNLFVRWHRNTGLFIGTIVGLGLIGAGAATFVIIRKRRED